MPERIIQDMKKVKLPEKRIMHDIFGSKKGYMTVEAAFVMFLVIAVIVFIIFSGFFLCDRCVMLGGAYEGSVWGANKKALKGDVAAGEMSKEAEKHAVTIFFNGSSFNDSVSLSETKVSVNANKNVFIVPFLDQVMAKSKWSINTQAKCYCPDKERIIRLTKAVIQLKDRK